MSAARGRDRRGRAWPRARGIDGTMVRQSESKYPHIALIYLVIFPMPNNLHPQKYPLVAQGRASCLGRGTSRPSLNGSALAGSGMAIRPRSM